MSVNGLEKITEKILFDARAQAEEIERQARTDAELITKTYEAQADEIRRRLSAEAEKRGEDMVGRARADAAMQKRNLLLEQRRELIDGVFRSAKEWVLALPKEKYAELLAGLLAAALYELVESEENHRALYGEEEAPAEAYEAVLNQKDRASVGAQVLALTRKKLSGRVSKDELDKLSLSAATAAIDGGLILNAGEVEMNCSLSMLFSGLQRDLEAEVSDALFAPRGQKA